MWWLGFEWNKQTSDFIKKYSYRLQCLKIWLTWFDTHCVTAD